MSFSYIVFWGGRKWTRLTRWMNQMFRITMILHQTWCSFIAIHCATASRRPRRLFMIPFDVIKISKCHLIYFHFIYLLSWHTFYMNFQVIMLSGTTAVVYWTDPTLPKGQVSFCILILSWDIACYDLTKLNYFVFNFI